MNSSHAFSALAFDSDSSVSSNNGQYREEDISGRDRDSQEALLASRATSDWLTCPVCLETPTTTPVQCRHGHILCQTCSQRIYRCPTCRVVMNPCQPIRCLVAFQALEETTRHRYIRCKAAPACNWMGPLNMLEDHDQQCLPAVKAKLLVVVQQHKDEMTIITRSHAESQQRLELNLREMLQEQLEARRQYAQLKAKLDALSDSLMELKMQEIKSTTTGMGSTQSLVVQMATWCEVWVRICGKVVPLGQQDILLVKLASLTTMMIFLVAWLYSKKNEEDL